MIPLSALAQNNITVVKYRSGKHIKIGVGDVLHVKANNSKHVMIGFLDSVFSDSFYLKVTEDSMLVIQKTEIDWLRAMSQSTMTKITRVFGSTILTAGVVHVALGIANNTFAGVRPVITPTMIDQGVMLTGIGAVIYIGYRIFKFKKYKRDKWRIQLNDFENLVSNSTLPGNN
jgi:hypothetical protein